MSPNTNIGYFSDLIKECIKFYENNKDEFESEPVGEKRILLSHFIEKFHREADTLNSAVKEKINTLRTKNPLILMTGHQPNFFPYSGVMRKATLNHALENELEKQIGVKVISFFGIADQDFSDERWVQSTLFPSINRRDGIFNLNIKIPKNIIFHNIDKPSKEVFRKCKNEINTWLNDAISSIDHLNGNNGINNWDYKKRLLYDNFKTVWKKIEESYEKASTFSDFNSFVMSKIINDCWNYNTLFSRFSECQSIFTDEFNYLIKNINTYSASINKAVLKIGEKTQKRGVSKSEAIYLPFWYHCDCGSKARLQLKSKGENLIGYGNCINCNKKININIGTKNKPDISTISTIISARAIPMILVFSRGLGLTNYVGGAAGTEYLEEAKIIANELNIALPPFAFWRPHDIYLGIGQLEAKLEYMRITGHDNFNKHEEEIKKMEYKISEIYKEVKKYEDRKKELIHNMNNELISRTVFENQLKILIEKINHIKKNSNIFGLNRDLKIIKNTSNTINLIPSIIDYAINIGLEETSNQWINYLTNDGLLLKDIYLTSVINYL